MGQIILPRRRALFTGGAAGGGANSSWSTWDGTTETALGDTTKNHMMIVQGANAGDNEGGIGWNNETWTQAGNVAGLSGGYRLMDATNDNFTFPQTLSNIFAGTDTFSIIFQVDDVKHSGSVLLWIKDLAGNDNIQITPLGADVDRMKFVVTIGGVAKLNDTPVNDFPLGAGPFWIALCCDGSNYFAGFTTTGSGDVGQPIKWSDFAAGDRVSNTVAAAQFNTDVFNTHRIINEETAASWLGMKLKMIFFSRNCVIDFNS